MKYFILTLLILGCTPKTDFELAIEFCDRALTYDKSISAAFIEGRFFCEPALDRSRCFCSIKRKK